MGQSCLACFAPTHEGCDHKRSDEISPKRNQVIPTYSDLTASSAEQDMLPFEKTDIKTFWALVKQIGKPSFTYKEMRDSFLHSNQTTAWKNPDLWK